MEETTESSAADGARPQTPSGGAKPVAAVLFAAGLLAGLASWAAGEACHDLIRPVTRQVTVMGGGGTSISDGPAVSRAGSRNAALIYGISGGCLGLFLALAGVRGTNRSPVKSGGIGLVLGAVVGAAAGYGLASVYWSVWFGTRSGLLDADGLFFPVMIKAGLCAAIGAAAGVSFGLARGDDPGTIGRFAGSGLVGGILAAVVFELCAAIFFSHVRSMHHPIPPMLTGRLLDRLMPAILIALLLLVATNPRKSSTVVNQS